MDWYFSFREEHESLSLLLLLVMMGALVFLINFCIYCVASKDKEKTFRGSLHFWAWGNKAAPDDKLGDVPPWLSIACIIFVSYLITGAFACGPRIYERYPSHCHPKTQDCTDASTALLLWPLFLTNPQALKGFHLR